MATQYFSENDLAPLEERMMEVFAEKIPVARVTLKTTDWQTDTATGKQKCAIEFNEGAYNANSIVSPMLDINYTTSVTDRIDTIDAYNSAKVRMIGAENQVSMWTELDAPPEDYSKRVIYNGYMYVFRTYNTSLQQYKWDGEHWEASEITVPRAYAEIVSYNGALYAIGGEFRDGSTWYSQSTVMSKWVDGSWVDIEAVAPQKVGSGRYLFGNVEYNNELHVFFSNTHYKFNGSTWSQVSTVPFSTGAGYPCVVYNNEIHILGGTSSTSDGAADMSYTYKYHYKWNGVYWSRIEDLPESSNRQLDSYTVYKNAIYCLYYHDYSPKVYKYDGTSWTIFMDFPAHFYRSWLYCFKNKLNAFIDDTDGYNDHHYQFIDGTDALLTFYADTTPTKDLPMLLTFMGEIKDD